MSTTMIIVGVLAVFLIYVGVTGRTVRIMNIFAEAG